MEITNFYREQVLEALLEARKKYTGTDAGFARQYGINTSVFNALKQGNIEKKLGADKWLEIGMRLNVTTRPRKWNLAETEVFFAIKGIVELCKKESKLMIIADECAIGKTYAAQYLNRTMENCFYVDASQYRTQARFIKALASAIGVSNRGFQADVYDRIRYSLPALPNPVIIIDEAGDLCPKSFDDIKALENSTRGTCGMILLGADGLRARMRKGIEREKQSYRELFSRFGDRCQQIVPTGKNERIAFYKRLITDVLSKNMNDKQLMNRIINRCLDNDLANGESTGLRRAETLLILETKY